MKHLLRHYGTWLLAGLGLANLLTLTSLDLWHFGPAFVGVYMLVVPGLLILSFLTDKKLPLPIGVTLSVALSIFLLMGLGLAVNAVIPLFDTSMPLDPAILLPAFNIVTLLLMGAAIWRRRALPLKRPKLDLLDWWVVGGSVLMPILSVMGAISLNNHGSNLFTMCALGLIAGYLPLLLYLRKRLNVTVVPIVLYLMAVSLLLMNSMRGWFITGHDVLREYHVFQLTHSTGHWDIGAFRDPYNACLSITILPTYLQHLLQIDGVYIYKFVFQWIGALPVIPIFYLFRKYTSGVVALLSAFIYISFPAFMVDMSMLNRQGVGLLFFSLLVYILLSNYFVIKKRRSLLLVLLGIGMIVAHYSTSYVAVSMLVLGYAINLLARWLLRRKLHKGLLRKLKVMQKLFNKKIYLQPSLLPFSVVAALFVAAFLWNGPVTQTSKGITDTLEKIVVSLGEPAKQDDSSIGTTKYSLVADKQLAREELFDRFVDGGLVEERTSRVASNLFPIASTEAAKYKSYSVAEPTLPITSMGSLSPFNLGSLYEGAKQAYAKVLQILLLVGLAGTLLGYHFRRNIKRALPLEYLALVLAGIGLMAFYVLVPSAVDYGVLRLFQQNLVLMALPMTLGFMLLVGFVLRKAAAQLIAYTIVTLGFFLILSGFLPQLTGGGRPALALNNNGFYYDAYYTHAEEVASFEWLKTNYDPRYQLQTDRHFTALKLRSYSELNGEGSRLLPATIKRDSFVLVNHTAVAAGTVVEYQDGEIIYYYFPLQFLKDHKNQIYSTDGSAIYK